MEYDQGEEWRYRMPELNRRDLRRLVDLADHLTEVAGPEQIGPVLLQGLGQFVGGETAIWHEVDLREPVQEFAVGWPPDRFTLEFAQRAAPVVHTHPLIDMSRAWLRKGVGLPPLGRLSEYTSRRKWHETPLYRELLRDVDDQMLLITATRGPLVQFVSVERAGRSYTDRDLDLFAGAARQIRAAVRRARTGNHIGLQTAPQAGWAIVDPRNRPARPDPGGLLTERQQQVLSLVAEGLTDTQIGRQLGLTGRTVSKHLQRIYSTLDVTNRIAALAAARPPVSRNLRLITEDCGTTKLSRGQT